MMKSVNLFNIALMAMLLVLGACKSSKSLEKSEPSKPVTTADTQNFLQKVSDNNVQSVKFITSKIKFQVQVGAQDLTLTGNLKMKRDDVIRLQLMAFGFVEAGRLEFTKDYVLIMDRINKQYLKVPYNQLDFLRTSGLYFYSLQALFWNELFQPGKMRLTDEAMNEYETSVGDGDVVISLEHDKMSYKWLAGSSKAEIKMANILYKDKLRGNTQLNWDYNNFKPLGSKQFPTDNAITFTTSSGKEIKLNMKLNYIGNESDWETRTEVSGKYKQVKVDDILRRFMAL